MTKRMAKEEAIKTLQKQKAEYIIAEAFDMAIEALQFPQYEEWQDEFNKMCESARPKGFTADEWYKDTFKGEEE